MGVYSLVACVLLLVVVVDVGSATRCFCDQSNCGDDLLCTDDYCLIGISDDDVVERRCVNASSQLESGDCAENWSGWRAVCVCGAQGDFCNSFSYLRSRMRQLRTEVVTTTVVPPTTEATTATKTVAGLLAVGTPINVGVGCGQLPLPPLTLALFLVVYFGLIS